MIYEDLEMHPGNEDERDQWENSATTPTLGNGGLARRIPADVEREDSDSTPVPASPFKRHGQHTSLVTILRVVQSKSFAHWYPQLIAPPLLVGEGSETFAIDPRRPATAPIFEQLKALIPDLLALEPHATRDVCFVVGWNYDIDGRGKRTRNRIAVHIAPPPDDWRLWPSALPRLAADCDASNEVVAGLFGTRLERAPESRDDAKVIVAARVAELPKPGEIRDVSKVKPTWKDELSKDAPKLDNVFERSASDAPAAESGRTWQETPSGRGTFFDGWNHLASEFGISADKDERQFKRYDLTTIITGNKHLSSWPGTAGDLLAKMREQLLKERQPVTAITNYTKEQWADWEEAIKTRYPSISRAMILEALSDWMEQPLGIQRYSEFTGALDDASQSVTDYIKAKFPATKPLEEEIDEKAPSSVETKLPAVVEPATPLAPVSVPQSGTAITKPVSIVANPMSEAAFVVLFSLWGPTGVEMKFTVRAMTADELDDRIDTLVKKFTAKGYKTERAAPVMQQGASAPAQTYAPPAASNAGVATCMMIKVGQSFNGAKPQLEFMCDGYEHPLRYTKANAGMLAQLLGQIQQINGAPFTAADLTTGRMFPGQWLVDWREAMGGDEKMHRNVVSVRPMTVSAAA